ncbi:isocitrate/isopropylmalate dehydrogenase family protein [bacterium]|nr:isocitrate/isopropylmalate dehydrogenase family protein [bacterium]
MTTTSSPYQIAVLAGDGIGPEVTNATLSVLQHLCEITPGLELQFTSYPAGATHYRETGVALPRETLDACLAADAVLLCAVGLPDVRKPDGTEVQPDIMMVLRRELGLYAAVRPCKLYPGVSSPLARTEPGIDFVILRENLEGLFASYGGGCLVGDDVATDTIVMTRKGVERIVDYAFQLSRRRTGRPSDGKRVVTCVDKANIFRSFAFFRKVFQDVAAQYPDITAEAAYVDAMSLYLVQNPSAYDVLVMENQFGDILSDLGAGLVGGLGMAPSAEIGDHHALFQPSHGTAPTIAGQNLANPLATILSAAMMLDWLGSRYDDSLAKQAGVRLEQAVVNSLGEGTSLTRDLGGMAGTTLAAEAVITALNYLCS